MIPGRLIGLRGRITRPFWGMMGVWAVLCGALASNHLRWGGEQLLTLALVLLLAELAWGSLWDLGAGVDWFRPLAEGWPPVRPASLRGLPYTQPGSPGGRSVRGFNRLVGWWRASFWPSAGPALLGVLAASVLAAALTLLLPTRLGLLNAMLVALVGLGVAQRRRGKASLGGEALAQIGLGWLAGHLAFAEVSAPSSILALAFAFAGWGSLRVCQGLGAGLWLLNGGLVVAVAVLAATRQPLAAGLVGFLLLGQVAVQPSLGHGADPERIARRMWPWLMAAMLAAALALP
jgi:hypothetical protein